MNAVCNDVQGESDNVFNLSESDKNARYVDYYDMCDVYKKEVIPASEVVVHWHRHGVGPHQADAEEHSQHTSDSRLVPHLGCAMRCMYEL